MAPAFHVSVLDLETPRILDANNPSQSRKVSLRSRRVEGGMDHELVVAASGGYFGVLIDTACGARLSASLTFRCILFVVPENMACHSMD